MKVVCSHDHLGYGYGIATAYHQGNEVTFFLNLSMELHDPPLPLQIGTIVCHSHPTSFFAPLLLCQICWAHAKPRILILETTFGFIKLSQLPHQLFQAVDIQSLAHQHEEGEDQANDAFKHSVQAGTDFSNGASTSTRFANHDAFRVSCNIRPVSTAGP